ncbi:hypothetical protein [Pseudomonas cerasi]|uniref:Uncharacterized protein n=1 Tax=Pseudomonas cerasi TaxID=1583341 RepID=A0A193SGT9_9PSED|nr:hypothetical protein [Pseudomonas cerasi]CZT26158.1 hypothetical protein PCPL58_p3064 [Pseudomonas cerasi]SOS30232.1 hypothetical protein PL963_P200109 [Pseudomonas cerasi]
MSHHKTPDAPAGMLVLDQRQVSLMDMFAGADDLLAEGEQAHRDALR